MPSHRTLKRRLAPSALAALGAILLGLSACDSGAATDPATSPPASSGPSAPVTQPPGTTAENALYFYPPVEGAKLVMSNSGGVTGTSEVTVTGVDSGADGQTVTVKEVNAGAGSTPVTVDRKFRTAADGSLHIDATAFGATAPGFTAAASGDDVVIPSIADLESGKSTNGKTFVEYRGSGVTMRNDVTYVVTGGGFTSVSTKAGTMEAYLVKLALDINSSVAGAVKGTATYWFKPGFGLVRQETEVAGVTLVSELTSSSVPFA